MKLLLSVKTYEISPCGRNDLLFRAFGEGAWWRLRRHQAPPDYITACHSERSEESHYNIINETFFIGQQCFKIKNKRIQNTIVKKYSEFS